MDAQVNNFLDEINKLAPLNNVEEEVWKKCFDSKSGYYYYWNTKTNDVTWNIPTGYKIGNQTTKQDTSLPRNSALTTSLDNVKVNGNNILDSDKQEVEKSSEIQESPPEKDAHDDQEKVQEPRTIDQQPEDSFQHSSKKIEEEVTINENTSKNDIAEDNVPEIETNQNVKISLVANYSDSEEELHTSTETLANNSPRKPLFPIKCPEETTVQSNLLDNFNMKAFQRKRRIGVSLPNRKETTDSSSDDKGDDSKGLGFSNTPKPKLKFNNYHTNFKRGEIMFANNEKATSSKTVQDEPNKNDFPELGTDYNMLIEKLNFLCEGRDPVMPIQEMLIQLKTLHQAMESGNLNVSYFQKWLHDTFSELVKLEQNNAPEGWMLKWDRSHKRYYYENESTGECQWDFPQNDVTRCDEAMDICSTSPSSTEQSIQLSPPMPPKISIPSPPSPPIISMDKSQTKSDSETSNNEVVKVEERIPNIPLTSEGVNCKLPPVCGDTKNNLDDVLSSFYSDIAEIGSANCPSSNDNLKKENVEYTEGLKKKKRKVKLLEGIAMKKKGVSKLVEKWNSVQSSYNN